MIKNNSIFVAASLMAAASLWGCGSNYTSGGDQTGAGTTLATANTVGISNCLTCHSPYSTLVQDYLVSRHGNHMKAAAKLPNDTETPPADPLPTCDECHDPYGDGAKIDLVQAQAAIVANGNTAKADWTVPGSIVGCEACHGGGQFHNGIVAGIPFATPGPKQCGQCHYLNNELAKPEWIAEGLYPHHTTSSNGNNVRRNISDSHYDNPATSVQAGNSVVEGYTVRTNKQNGCVDCHFNGHAMDLTKNYQWAKSGHAGELKTIKNAALAAGAPDAATLLANVTAAGAPGADFAWGHYDWDDTASRGACQVCHTSTGISNFLDNPKSYDLTGKGNNYSHLVGWKADDPNTPAIDNVSSPQNELLFCWGCHSDSNGTLRNPGSIPLDYTYNGAQVIIPDVRKSNVCVKCHGGRGNNDTILANVAAADVSLNDNVERSTRAAEHHAPTAGSLFAAQTHTAYEYAGMVYSSTNPHASINTGSTGSGPCASCHMGAATSQDHTFAATEHDASGNIVAINHLTVCESCHGVGGMTVASLEAQKDGFAAAKTLLNSLLKNNPSNYLGKDIGTTANNNYKTAPVGAYGAFMNNGYLGEEPCVYVHNNLYGRRVLYDSIKFMKDGNLTGTLNLTGYAAAAEFINGGVPADITAVARP
jgi:hypothetical protein